MAKYSRNKYNAVSVKINQLVFGSKKEARRYQILKHLEEQGIITDLKVHPVYVLQEAFRYQDRIVRPIRYIADFEYQQKDKTIVEDVKGVETEVFKLKRKLFWFKYPQYELRVL